MKRVLARAIPLLMLCVLFVVNDEIFSLVMLSVLLVLFIGKIIAEREKCRG